MHHYLLVWSKDGVEGQGPLKAANDAHAWRKAQHFASLHQFEGTDAVSVHRDDSRLSPVPQPCTRA